MKQLLVFTILLTLYSCKSNSIKKNYFLKSTGPIYKDKYCKKYNPKSKYLQYFERNNEEWLFYGNRDQNELIIYKLPSGNIIKRIQYEERGPNGIGKFKGAIVVNFDSIFVLSGTYYNSFFLTDTIGRVIHKYNLERDSISKFNTAISPLFCYTDDPFKDNSLNLSTYVFSSVKNKELFNEIISVKYDLTNNILEKKYYFPKFQEQSKATFKNYFRAFNSKLFVYSFCNIEDIFLQTSETKYTRYPGKSQYQKRGLSWKVDGKDPVIKQKMVLKNPKYLGIMYDKYRKYIYRIFIPGIDNVKPEQIENKFSYFDKFSIIIFDQNLNIIGETMLPNKSYDPNMAFVAKDGLYIALHYDNPLYNPDSLTFEKIEIKYK